MSAELKTIVRVSSKVVPETFSSPHPEKDSQQPLGDFIEDAEISKPEDSATRNIIAEELANLVDQLPAPQAKILRLHYGLTDGKSHTLKEVGLMVGLSGESIRLLKIKALEFLRDPNRTGRLGDFYRSS